MKSTKNHLCELVFIQPSHARARPHTTANLCFLLSQPSQKAL
ncbi:hypothetical protein HMPREF9999_01116 [Alloprevotella sp. oral taxon 473 str. F0040]|nr:hypothetical protein HMPREF9999_01116 [Alloprevotella sp. oral taxon 473 str. F0040]